MSDNVCKEFAPFDDSDENELYYIRTLKERQEEYSAVVNDYSDGRWDI